MHMTNSAFCITTALTIEAYINLPYVFEQVRGNILCEFQRHG